MSDTTLSPTLRHLLIHESHHNGYLHLPAPELVASSRDDSPPGSPEPSYRPLSEKLPPSSVHATPLISVEAILGHRPSPSIFSLLNSLTVESPPSSPGLVSPRSSPGLLPTESVQRIPPPPLSAPLMSSGHPPWFTREHRPSVDVPSTSMPRPDMHRRPSAHPYEVNPATNRIVYREFDFTPVGSRTPISRTTKACNACRSRKVRCDAGGDMSAEPASCSRCAEAGLECVYSGAQKKRGPCPGVQRPGMAPRRTSQRVVMTPPPELSPTLTNRDSYGFPPYDSDQYYQPPLTPNDPYPPPMHFQHQPLHQHGSGWTSTHPRPLANPSTFTRKPPSSASSHSRQPSIVSWHPSDIPEERSQVFEKEYSMQALADESAIRVADGDWRNDHEYRRPSEIVSKQPPMSGSSFGGDGRSLPPLRIALGGGSTYREPWRD